MLETIVSFLVSVVIAAAGATGLDVATATPRNANADAIAVSLEDELAEIAARVAEARANRADSDDVTVTVGAEEGLSTAAASIDAAKELAPAAADPGLTTAETAVDTAPTDGGDSAGAPDDVPTGAPEGVPSGAPEGVPSGRP